MDINIFYSIEIRGTRDFFELRDNISFHVGSEAVARALYEKLNKDYLESDFFLPNQTIPIGLKRIYKTKNKTVPVTLEKKIIELGHRDSIYINKKNDLI